MRIFFLITLIAFSSCTVSKQTASNNPYTGNQVGCGGFIVYKLTDDNKSYLSVALTVSSIELTSRQAFAIDKADIVEVKRVQYDVDIASALCNDVMRPRSKPLADEVATNGIVEIVISEEELTKANKNSPYEVTVILKDVSFSMEVVDYLRIDKVKVGWLPG